MEWEKLPSWIKGSEGKKRKGREDHQEIICSMLYAIAIKQIKTAARKRTK